MIEPGKLLNELDGIGVSCYFGVPDSTLKHFCSFVSRTLSTERHTICVNEGVAVASAIGYHLATGKIPTVYMQNSGLGNAVNPLTSLAAKEIYSVPILLLVGWRGEPNVKDEPQHVFQGRITQGMLDLLEIPYTVLDSNSDIKDVIREVHQYFIDNQSPYALLVRKGTFSAVSTDSKHQDSIDYHVTREEAIQTIVDAADSKSVVVSTTGMASRELFEIRNRQEIDSCADFLTVGGMGCASSIALGISNFCSDTHVICIDGDGAALMHMGAMGTIGFCSHHQNMLHVVINNGEHGSTGGQPTISRKVSLCDVAKACGYQSVFHVDTLDELSHCVKNSVGTLTFIEMMTNNRYRSDLGRPTKTAIDNKESFVRKIKNAGLCGKK